MTQASGIVSNGDGGSVRAQINENLQAVFSTSKGSSPPSTAYPGQLWVDDNTPSTTVWTLSIYDGAEWIELALIDIAANTVAIRPASVGIGTNSPIRPLTISSNSSAEMVLQDTSRPANQRNTRLVYSGGKLILGGLNDAGNTGSNVFAIDPTTGHMYFNQFTTPGPGIGNTTTGGGYFNEGANGGALSLSRASQCPLFLNNNTNSGIATTYQCAGSTVGSVVVYSAYTTFNTSSDRRKKTYIKPYKDSGAVIDGLNVVIHGWRGFSGLGKHVGVLAQEAYEVFPAAVTKGDDNPDLKEGDDGFVGWQVDNSKFVPVMLAELKALRERVATLEGQLPVAP